MIKNKLPSKLIKERLSKIEESAPSDRPIVVFIEKKKNEWNVTELYEALNKKTRISKYAITNINKYMENNSDVPILVDYKINDNNVYTIWHILLQLANEEELDMLVDYVIDYINSNEQKNIKFTKYLMKLTDKYKEQFINVNLEKKYDRLNHKQLKRLLEVLEK